MTANTLWQKNGSTPVPLPPSDRDTAGLPWDNLETNSEGRTACGWSQAPAKPGYNPETQQCVWTGTAWSIESYTPPATVVTVSHYEFSQLLTMTQKVKIAAAKAQIRGMTATNYTDSAYAGLIALEQVFAEFDLAADIELTSPTTIYAVETIMVGAGILTPVQAAQVLANIPSS
jgi:hypothetical protein